MKKYEVKCLECYACPRRTSTGGKPAVNFDILPVRRETLSATRAVLARTKNDCAINFASIRSLTASWKSHFHHIIFGRQIHPLIWNWFSETAKAPITFFRTHELKMKSELNIKEPNGWQNCVLHLISDGIFFCNLITACNNVMIKIIS